MAKQITPEQEARIDALMDTILNNIISIAEGNLQIVIYHRAQSGMINGHPDYKTTIQLVPVDSDSSVQAGSSDSNSSVAATNSGATPTEPSDEFDDGAGLHTMNDGSGNNEWVDQKFVDAQLKIGDPVTSQSVGSIVDAGDSVIITTKNDVITNIEAAPDTVFVEPETLTQPDIVLDVLDEPTNTVASDPVNPEPDSSITEPTYDKVYIEGQDGDQVDITTHDTMTNIRSDEL